MEVPNDSEAEIYKKTDFIDGKDCEVPQDQRELVMPDGQIIRYPLDMWPPVPGQECRPHILRTLGTEVEPVPTKSGYMDSFYPGGLHTPRTQKAIDRRVQKRFPDHESKPQKRPFAGQLRVQGYVYDEDSRSYQKLTEE